MNKVDGITLLQIIKSGKIKEGTKIVELYHGLPTQHILKYENGEVIWKPGEFVLSDLYNDNYTFGIIEDRPKEIEKLTLKGKDIGYGVMKEWLDFTPNDNEQKICSAIEATGIVTNEIIRAVNYLLKKDKEGELLWKNMI
ncbi:MAG: hypothetical protein K2M17_03380 [Bacilli bacterium]|nr:hypothetical protein [Bacilli bacterium]